MVNFVFSFLFTLNCCKWIMHGQVFSEEEGRKKNFLLLVVALPATPNYLVQHIVVAQCSIITDSAPSTLQKYVEIVQVLL